MTNITINTAVELASEKFLSIGRKDRNLFMQLLISLKYPLHHVMSYDASGNLENWKIYKKAYNNKSKREFNKDPRLFVIKRNESDDRIGPDWREKALELNLGRIIAMFYIFYDEKPVPLQDIFDEFVEDKYSTMKKYSKTSGKNADNFTKHRSAGRREVLSVKDESEAYEAHWRGYKRHGQQRSIGFETFPTSSNKKYGGHIEPTSYVAPENRKVMYVEFNPEVDDAGS
jgi:hypothetical protein